METRQMPDIYMCALWMDIATRHVREVCTSICFANCFVCSAVRVCDICGCGELAERSVHKTKQNNREAVKRKTVVVCE